PAAAVVRRKSPRLGRHAGSPAGRFPPVPGERRGHQDGGPTGAPGHPRPAAVMNKPLTWSLLALAACLGSAAPAFADAFGLFYQPSYCCRARYPSQPKNAFSCMCYADNAFTDACVFHTAFTPWWCNPCMACGACGKKHHDGCLPCSGWWHKLCGPCGLFGCCKGLPVDECSGGYGPYPSAFNSVAAAPEV